MRRIGDGAAEPYSVECDEGGETCPSSSRLCESYRRYGERRVAARRRGVFPPAVARTRRGRGAAPHRPACRGGCGRRRRQRRRRAGRSRRRHPSTARAPGQRVRHVPARTATWRFKNATQRRHAPKPVRSLSSWFRQHPNPRAPPRNALFATPAPSPHAPPRHAQTTTITCRPRALMPCGRESGSRCVVQQPPSARRAAAGPRARRAARRPCLCSLGRSTHTARTMYTSMIP